MSNQEMDDNLLLLQSGYPRVDLPNLPDQQLQPFKLNVVRNTETYYGPGIECVTLIFVYNTGGRIDDGAGGEILVFDAPGLFCVHWNAAGMPTDSAGGEGLGVISAYDSIDWKRLRNVPAGLGNKPYQIVNPGGTLSFDKFNWLAGTSAADQTYNVPAPSTAGQTLEFGNARISENRRLLFANGSAMILDTPASYVSMHSITGSTNWATLQQGLLLSTYLNTHWDRTQGKPNDLITTLDDLTAAGQGMTWGRRVKIAAHLAYTLPDPPAGGPWVIEIVVVDTGAGVNGSITASAGRVMQLDAVMPGGFKIKADTLSTTFPFPKKLSETSPKFLKEYDVRGASNGQVLEWNRRYFVNGNVSYNFGAPPYEGAELEIVLESAGTGSLNDTAHSTSMAFDAPLWQGLKLIAAAGNAVRMPTKASDLYPPAGTGTLYDTVNVAAAGSLVADKVNIHAGGIAYLPADAPLKTRLQLLPPPGGMTELRISVPGETINEGNPAAGTTAAQLVADYLYTVEKTGSNYWRLT